MWIDLSLMLGYLGLLFLVLRFVQPEIIYWVRQAIVEARKNRAFLLVDANEKVGSYPELLVADLRPEGVPRDLKDVLARVTKIRELYAVLDWRRPKGRELARSHKPNVCILELGNILKSLALRIKPSKDVVYSAMKANEILLQVARHRGLGVSDDASDNEIERHFLEHNISIEQINEILVACIYAVNYRIAMAESDEGNSSGKIQRL